MIEEPCFYFGFEFLS